MIKIKTIIVLLCFFCLLNCKKQAEEIKLIEENYQNFEYNEELVLESTENYKNWKIKCKAIECKISFIIGSTKKEELFSKNITFKDKKEIEKMIKLILKGMKKRNNPESHSDFYPNNLLIVNNKEIFSTQQQNITFYNLLRKKLLKEDYRKIEEKTIIEYKNKQEKQKLEQIKFLSENIIEKEYEKFSYKETERENLGNWELICEKLNCKINYYFYDKNDREEKIIFSKNITLNKNEKEKIVKRILKGFYKAQEIKNENLYLLSDFSYSNNKSIIRNEITNIEFYDILTQLIGKNYKDIEQQIIHEIEEKEKQENLKILKDNKIKNFIYEEEIIFNDLKEKKWSLECKKLDCKIEYGVRKVAHTDDFIIKFNKNIRLTDEIQRDKILKRITEDIKTNNHNNSEFYVYFMLTTENNKKIQIFSNYSNKNFYKILNELLAQDYKNIEKNSR